MELTCPKVFVKGNITEGALVETLHSKEVRGWTCGGCGALPLPVLVSDVVGSGPDGAFPHVSQKRDDVVVSDIATKFQVAVNNGAQ